MAAPGYWEKKRKEQEKAKNETDALKKSANNTRPSFSVAFVPYNNISWISHWNGPSQVVVTTECAQLLTTKPFSWGICTITLEVKSRPVWSEQVASEEHGTTDDTQTLDNDITIQVLLVLSQTGVDLSTSEKTRTQTAVRWTALNR